MDETKTEFDLLVQRTKQRITISERLERSIQLLERPSPFVKKISGWGDFVRNAYNTGKSLFFQKRI